MITTTTIIIMTIIIIIIVITWTKNELQNMDRATRKIMTMNKELYPRSDTARIYLIKEERGKRTYVCGEENNLSWCVRNSEVLLRKIGEKGTVKVDEAKDPKEYKKSEKKEMGNKWKENKCMGYMSETWQE